MVSDVEFENMLYQYASDEMMKAREWQNQVSSKELSIKLNNINESYGIFYGETRMKMENDLKYYKTYRDTSVHFAIEHALSLAEYELDRDKEFILSSTLFSNINCFNQLYNVRINNMTYTIVPRLVKLQTELMKSGKMPCLLTEIDKMIKYFGS